MVIREGGLNNYVLLISFLPWLCRQTETNDANRRAAEVRRGVLLMLDTVTDFYRLVIRYLNNLIR
ncbi:MAG: hypothetical protein GXO90_01525 [FCB group bacterium]|nr:hypothetical protein [FCB group bacterium]